VRFSIQIQITCRYVVVDRHPQGAEPEYDTAFTDTWGLGGAEARG